ncbi:MAG TPA: hypothetical protein VK841_11585 [Polyangiaceae bacterium]|nr:hypothetical protein [Polyangiaceae bacterium]
MPLKLRPADDAGAKGLGNLGCYDRLVRTAALAVLFATALSACPRERLYDPNDIDAFGVECHAVPAGKPSCGGMGPEGRYEVIGNATCHCDPTTDMWDCMEGG